MIKKAIIWILLFGLAGYIGMKIWGPQDKAAVVAPPKNLTISVVQPSHHVLANTLKVMGRLVPREDVIVISELSNVKLRELRAEVGQKVEKGQVLALLDAESLQFQAQQQSAEYDKVKDDFTRTELLKDSGAISKATLVEKKASLDAAKAKLQDSALAVRRATITAPDGGVIYERRATLGSLVAANEPLFRIAQNGVIEAELKVPENELSKVSIDQPVQLSITGSEQEISAKVRLVAPNVDSASRTAAVRVQVDGKLPAAVGSFVRGEIALDQIEGLSVPSSAVQFDGDKNFVWTVGSDNKVVRKHVKLTFETDKLALVEGLDETARVVAKAGSFVKAGETVNPVKGE